VVLIFVSSVAAVDFINSLQVDRGGVLIQQKVNSKMIELLLNFFIIFEQRKIAFWNLTFPAFCV
jgi:hypothetical protein